MSLSFCFFHFLDPMPIVACPRGKYYDINAKEKIDPTQKYHFYPTYDITNINPWEICQDCPTGWSQLSEFSFQCLECPPGQVADKTRAFNCTECIAKTYQDVSGKKDCLKCRSKSVPRP